MLLNVRVQISQAVKILHSTYHTALIDVFQQRYSLTIRVLCQKNQKTTYKYRPDYGTVVCVCVVNITDCGLTMSWCSSLMWVSRLSQWSKASGHMGQGKSTVPGR